MENKEELLKKLKIRINKVFYNSNKKIKERKKENT